MFFYITQGLRIEETRKSFVFFAPPWSVEHGCLFTDIWGSNRSIRFGYKKDFGFFLDFLHENQSSTPYKIECTPSVVMKLPLSCHARQVTTDFFRMTESAQKLLSNRGSFSPCIVTLGKKSSTFFFATVWKKCFFTSLKTCELMKRSKHSFFSRPILFLFLAIF